MRIDDKIKDEKLKYDNNRETTENISITIMKNC